MTEDNSVQQATAPEAPPVTTATTANDNNEFTQGSNTSNYVPQDKVNSIAGSARKNGYDSGYEKGLQDATSRASIPQQHYQQPAQQAVPAQQGNQSDSNAREDAARYVREEYDAHKRQLEEQDKQREEQATLDRFKQADDMLSKQKTNPEVLEKYPDFAEQLERVGNFQDPAMARVKYGASYFDNSLEMIYALSKDDRMADMIANAPSDERMLLHLQKYSEDLKSNSAAQNSKSPQQPLSDVNASTGLKINGNGSGTATWSTFKDDPRLMS